jgi:glycosyltransferase involved in cell wall biosynthesis
MKKTIGFYDDSQGPGGTTRYLLNLISGLDRSEFDLVFLAPHARSWHSDLVAAGLEVVTLFAEKAAENPVAKAATSPAARAPDRVPGALAWTLGLTKEVVLLRKLFRRRHVDLLHSNNAGAEAAPIAARMAGVAPVIATWHVDSTYDLAGVRGGWRYRQLEKTCMRSLHHVISVSKATAADWIGRCNLGESYWRRVTVIHNGVDTDKLTRTRSIEDAKAAAGLSGRMVIGSAGRLDAAKGYEYLIRGLPDLVQARPDVLVRIAGRGPLQAELLQLARSLGVERHLDLAGFVDDTRAFLEAVDIYVQPSLCEALPMAVLEACAVGLPVVASQVGGVAECVRDGEMGFVVPARQPVALVNALVRLAADPVIRERMGAEARRVAREHFECGQMVRKTVEVYRRLLRA